MHVWAAAFLHRMLYTSLAFVGEIPEADLLVGNIFMNCGLHRHQKWEQKSDGAWFMENKKKKTKLPRYFRMNTLTHNVLILAIH